MLYGKACVCQYDGTAYSGWQRQKNGISIQERLEFALKEIYGRFIKIAGSGRTDAGVHSLGQVFSFKSEICRPNSALIYGVNAFLPEDIAVIDALDVTLDFHAGKSLKSKTYLYKIINQSLPAPLHVNRAWWIKKHIDVDLLNEFLAKFEGVHDFESFCVRKTKKENTIRKINFIKVGRVGNEVHIEINASGFLHNMVRIMVGTAINGLIKGLKPTTITEIINKKDRRFAGVTAPAGGLYQKETFYSLNSASGLEGIPARFRP